jgi:hypothetical protein
MAEPVRVRRLTDQEGQRLQQIVRRGTLWGVNRRHKGAANSARLPPTPTPTATAREANPIAQAPIDLADSKPNGDPVVEQAFVREHPFYWISVPASWQQPKIPLTASPAA